ncbi:YciI family protein [Alphaproteobacteria bacterium KMM 3653]|uniref:YciI family protein n=1 Tax=Harenicola maris TaxID=2841044 RepID=A0AAP2G4B9_9RHOB|nr:YciI family protein [Harenicola maris]
MQVALICRDKPNSLDTRMANRPAHLDYLKSSGDMVLQAGALPNAEGTPTGSLIVLEVASLTDAKDWATNDPYAKAGLFEDVHIAEWKKVIG